MKPEQALILKCFHQLQNGMTPVDLNEAYNALPNKIIGIDTSNRAKILAITRYVMFNRDDLLNTIDMPTTLINEQSETGKQTSDQSETGKQTSDQSETGKQTSDIKLPSPAKKAGRPKGKGKK